jgi:hypothetical protein
VSLLVHACTNGHACAEMEMLLGLVEGGCIGEETISSLYFYTGK